MSRRGGEPVAAIAARWPLVGRSGELEVVATTVLDAQHDCIVLRGPASVGKSRLADECLAAAEAAGARIGRATAAAAISDLPLAALAHLLPTASPDDADPRVLLERAREHLGGESQFVLLIDDVPALDPAAP